MSINRMRVFERQVYLLMAGVAGLCLLLLLLTWLQGPRVRSASVDPLKITQLAGQRVLLQLSQAPGAVTQKQITVNPHAGFTAATAGKTVTIQFNQPLRSDTRYAVTIKTAAGKQINYAFTTGRAYFYYVVSKASGDEIHRRAIGASSGTPDDVLVTAGTIHDFLVLRGTIVYTDFRQAKPGENSVRLYDVASHRQRQLSLPGRGLADSLRATADGSTFGFIFTPADYTADSSLFTYDLSTLRRSEVTGLGGKHLGAYDWQFAQNGTAVAAVDNNSLLWLVNQGAEPVPLGEYSPLYGFTYDDGGLAVNSMQGGPQVINVRTATKSALVSLKDTEFVISADPLHTEQGSILHVQAYSQGVSWDELVANRTSGRTVLYSDADQGTQLPSGSLSPNDQYVAIESHNNYQDATTTRIIDTFTGKVVSQVAGSTVRWPLGY